MKRILTLIIFAALGMDLYAQSLTTNLIPTSVRELSLAGIKVRENIDTFGVDLAYGNWAPQASNLAVKGGTIAYAKPEHFYVSASSFFFTGKEYEQMGESGNSKGMFSPQDMILKLEGKIYIKKKNVLGLMVLDNSSAIGPDQKGNSISFRANYGFCTESFDVNLYAGTGQAITYKRDAYKVPTYIEADFAYRVGNLMTFLAQGGYEMVSSSIYAAAAAEVNVSKFASLRAGYHYGSLIPSHISLGASIGLFGFRLQAAYLLSSTVSNTLVFGLGYSF